MGQAEAPLAGPAARRGAGAGRAAAGAPRLPFSVLDDIYASAMLAARTSARRRGSGTRRAWSEVTRGISLRLYALRTLRLVPLPTIR